MLLYTRMVCGLFFLYLFSHCPNPQGYASLEQSIPFNYSSKTGVQGRKFLGCVQNIREIAKVITLDIYISPKYLLVPSNSTSSCY